MYFCVKKNKKSEFYLALFATCLEWFGPSNRINTRKCHILTKATLQAFTNTYNTEFY